MNILITGGTGKVGSQLIQHLSKEHQILSTSRRHKELESATFPENVRVISVDLEHENSANEIKKQADDLHFNVDVLIHSARNRDYVQPVHGMISRERWIGEYVLDVVVPYELSMVFREQLKKIILISSIYGIVAQNPNIYENYSENALLNYNAAKAAEINLTKNLAVLLRKDGITVNCISYGGIEGRVDSKFMAQYNKQCPLGRMMHEDEVAHAVDFLASGKSTYMTGHNLVVDGGWTIW
ncbi:MAG: SDR family oxidoreductase [Euryarchaeota archaeon]|nr:SDR family oxidoreductase [Euryarchaeota archaeon]